MSITLQHGGNVECGACGGDYDVRVLVARDDERGVTNGGVFLCAECRIKAEGLLRGARKSGPRVGQWSVAR